MTMVYTIRQRVPYADYNLACVLKASKDAWTPAFKRKRHKCTRPAKWLRRCIQSIVRRVLITVRGTIHLFSVYDFIRMFITHP
jgi:hypothetical protein